MTDIKNVVQEEPVDAAENMRLNTRKDVIGAPVDANASRDEKAVALSGVIERLAKQYAVQATLGLEGRYSRFFQSAGENAKPESKPAPTRRSKI